MHWAAMVLCRDMTGIAVYDIMGHVKMRKFLMKVADTYVSGVL